MSNPSISTSERYLGQRHVAAVISCPRVALLANKANDHSEKDTYVEGPYFVYDWLASCPAKRLICRSSITTVRRSLSVYPIFSFPRALPQFTCCFFQVFNAVNLGQIFMVAVIASAIWWQSDNVADIAGTMFFISIQQSFNGLNVSTIFLLLYNMFTICGFLFGGQGCVY